MTESQKITHFESVLKRKYDKNIVTLDASGTQLKELPLLPELRTLVARGTQLKELPLLPKLEYLDARGTQLKELPLLPKLITSKLSKQKETLILSTSIGSRYDITEYWKESDQIKCGCFEGTLKEFEAEVKQKYKTGIYRKQYLSFISKLKTQK